MRGSRRVLRAVPRIALPFAPAALCDRCLVAITGTEDFDLSKLRLRGARLLVDKVAPVGASQERKVESGLYMPAQSERIRRTFGIEARVLAIGPAIDPADISVGDHIIIDEFGGRPLWWNDRMLPYWIVGEGEVMIAVDRAPEPAP